MYRRVWNNLGQICGVLFEAQGVANLVLDGKVGRFQRGIVCDSSCSAAGDTNWRQKNVD